METETKVSGIDEFIQILGSVGIETSYVDFDKYGFSRTISFTVYGIEYRIVWFTNESTLRVGNHERAALIPFKYMYVDNCYPLVGGNKSVGFSYTKLERKAIFDRDYPYEVFRIPIEIQ